MKRMMRATLTSLMFVAALAVTTQAQEWSPSPGSWVKVNGTSTLHDWEVEVKKIDGKVRFPADFFETGEGDVAASVTIPAAELKSHSGRMDRVMYKALDTKAHPSITFKLVSAVPTSANEATVKGNLTIAGKTNPIEIPVTLTRPDEKKVVIAGSVELDMTDYGIDPPTAMLGTIRTGADVTVTFQWQLSLR